MIYKYFLPDHKETEEDAIEFVSYDENACNHNEIAEDAANKLYVENDGWEMKWPLNITILTLDNKNLGTYTIGVEFEPIFYTLHSTRIERDSNEDL